MTSKFIYRPSKISILFDFLFLTLCIIVVLRYFPLTTANPFEKYHMAAIVYLGIWFVSSYFLGRYKPLHKQKYVVTSFNLVYATLITFAVMWAISNFIFDKNFSIRVLISFTTVVFFINTAFHLLYFAILYAANYDEEEIIENELRTNAKLKQATPLDDESYNDLCALIKEHSGEKALQEISNQIDLRSGNTYVSFVLVLDEFKAKPKYKFSSIVVMQMLNNIRGINKLFATINTKLPDDGMMVCCFETKSTIKKRFFKKYPKGINYFIGIGA